MARIDTDLATVLTAIVNRLIDQVILPDGETALSDSTCFLWIDDGEDPAPASGDTFVTVEVDGGNFDEALFIGGSTHQVTDDTAVMVTVWSQSRLDPAMRDKEFLTNSLSVMPMFQKVLKALSGHDLVIDVAGDLCLRELIRPAGRGAPRKRGDSQGLISLRFAVSFDWDLT